MDADRRYLWGFCYWDVTTERWHFGWYDSDCGAAGGMGWAVDGSCCSPCAWFSGRGFSKPDLLCRQSRLCNQCNRTRMFRGVRKCSLSHTHANRISDPNPFPPPGATSETFVCAGTTTSFKIPTATTTVSAGGATIVLNSGGTPVNEPLASQCTEVAGIFPTWCKFLPSYFSYSLLRLRYPAQEIIPPPGVSIITFTGPLTLTPTWVTTVPVPPKSNSPEVTVIGPPGDKNHCNDLDLWTLLFNEIIHPCLPLDVGIEGGLTPLPIPPLGWTGPWTNPIPRPTPPPGGGPGDSNTETSTSTSSSSSSDAACPTKPASLDLPDDSDNSDWDDDGTDPDERRRSVNGLARGKYCTCLAVASNVPFRDPTKPPCYSPFESCNPAAQYYVQHPGGQLHIQQFVSTSESPYVFCASASRGCDVS
jgi:hypothetical protein